MSEAILQQPEPISSWQSNLWGGINAWDFAEQLVARSHRFDRRQGDWNQVNLLESPKAPNIEFFTQGFGKRLGSTEAEDLTGVLVASETLIDGYEWRNPTDGTRILIAVGVKSIYTNQSGSWAQINDSASAAYTHGADVSKVTFLELDGHLLMLIDGTNNHIQTYRSGADLDAELDNGNTYEDAHGGGTHSISGTWSDATYIGEVVHNSLAYCDGSPLIEITMDAHAVDSTGTQSGIWDLGNANVPPVFIARGNVRAIKSFVAEGGDENNQLTYVFTSNGPHILTGFEEIDRSHDRRSGGTPINHRSVVAAKNWLVYLTDDKRILGINGTRVIDLGRRLKSRSKDGPLDGISVAQSLTNALGYYDSENERVIFHATTASGRVNDVAFVIDMSLGEPVPGESAPQYEQRVRCLHWTIADADTNDWFKGMFKTVDGTYGVTGAGKMWTVGGSSNPRNDLDTIAVEDEWWSPIFSGGDTVALKNFLMLFLRFTESGDWDVNVDWYINRSGASAASEAINQLAPGTSVYGTAVYDEDSYAEEAMIRGSIVIHEHVEALQFRLYNQELDRYWVCVSAQVDYELGATLR